MTRDLAIKVRDDLNKAIAEVFKKYNLSGSINSVSYTNSDIKVKISAVEITDEVSSEEEVLFKRNAFLVGLKQEAYGTEFINGNSRFKLIGVKPNRPKFPILGKELKSGKIYKFDYSILNNPALASFKIN